MLLACKLSLAFTLGFTKWQHVNLHRALRSQAACLQINSLVPFGVLIAWLAGMQEALRNPGTAVAAGLPLVVRLLVPLWVVNATMLPIGVGITDVGAPPQPKAPEPGNPQRGKLDTDAIKMRVLDTNAPVRYDSPHRWTNQQ